MVLLGSWPSYVLAREIHPSYVHGCVEPLCHGTIPHWHRQSWALVVVARFNVPT